MLSIKKLNAEGNGKKQNDLCLVTNENYAQLNQLRFFQPPYTLPLPLFYLFIIIF